MGHQFINYLFDNYSLGAGILSDIGTTKRQITTVSLTVVDGTWFQLPEWTERYEIIGVSYDFNLMTVVLVLMRKAV